MRPLLLSLVLLAAVAARAQPEAPVAPLLDGLGDYARPADTDVALAQRFFDQGLVLSFAFNHAEAARAFREAQRLDPSCAMCAWGEALALGPHVNAPMNAEDAAPAWAALERARAGVDRLGDTDRALVEALGARYAADPPADRAPLDRTYAAVMRTVADEFPADADVQALFAEALMDTMPWDYWREDGSPKPQTEEVLAALDLALDAEPDHPLALHLLIHAVEKQRPELGVDAAERLGPLVPNAGHLVHMPGHIWMRVGRYHDAVVANQRAVLADDDYLAQCHAQGLYPLGYVPHNHHFLWVAAMMGGERATALASADHMGAHREHMAMPGMEFVQHFAMSPLYARAAFGMWDEVLAAPAPPDLVYPTAVWHAMRGLAFARTDRPAEAQRELDALRPLAADTSLGAQFGGLNSYADILGVAVPYLAGEVAAARGDADEAVRQLEAAVRLEDALTYDEPPPWALPSRWALGRVLMDAGRAREAEAVYRADLAVYPENGRGLAGLERALLEQGKNDLAEPLAGQIQAAWRWADVPLVAQAPSGASGQRFADLGTCPTEGGEPILDCRLAYRTHGRLNAARDNAVLVPMWYGGTSASMTDLLAPLGIDTTRSFVVVVEPLTVGASSAPSTSRRQPGDRFPAVTIGDMVDAQHRLVTDVLGVERLHAVLGYSMGGIQTIEWAVRYPDAVGRAASLLGTPWLDTPGRVAVGMLHALADYGDHDPEAAALALARAWHLVGRTPQAETAIPPDSLDALLAREAADEWASFDLDDNRRQLGAVLAYDARDAFGGDLDRTAAAVRARLLLAFSPGDHLTPPGPPRALAQATGADTLSLDAGCGHAAFGCDIARIGERLGPFLYGPTGSGGDDRPHNVHSHLGQNGASLDPAELALVNVAADEVTYRGRTALRLTDAAPEGAGDERRLAILPDIGMTDGAVDLWLAGAPGPDAPQGARGFVGLAFRVDDAAERFEAIYLRPTNGRAQSQALRNHATQYIASPEWGWRRLRTEEPFQYEAYVDLEAGAWTQVRVELDGERARLFVHGAPEPTLVVDLKHAPSEGGLALWVGPGTVAHVADVTVTPAR